MAGLEILGAIGAAVSAVGTLASASASIQAGDDQKAALEFKAKQEDQAAQESRAASQRQAIDKRREAEQLDSQLRARSAADGGTTTDPTIVNLGSEIAGRGEYQALGEMYKGENRARGIEDQAQGDRMTGAAAARGARSAAFGTILSGIGGIAGKFGKSGAGAYG